MADSGPFSGNIRSFSGGDVGASREGQNVTHSH